MVELLVLGGLVFAAAVVGLIGFAVVGLVKFVFWVVFLPIRLVFKLLTLPFLLIKWTFMGLFGLLLAPVALILLVVGLFGVLAALVAPLLPLLVLAFIVWALVRLFRGRPAVA